MKHNWEVDIGLSESSTRAQHMLRLGSAHTSWAKKAHDYSRNGGFMLDSVILVLRHAFNADAIILSRDGNSALS
jgi:hypothetical protein